MKRNLLIIISAFMVAILSWCSLFQKNDTIDEVNNVEEVVVEKTIVQPIKTNETEENLEEKVQELTL